MRDSTGLSMLWDRSVPHDVREALFGGQCAVRVWSLSAEVLPRPFTTALACELEPGGRVGRHVQEHDSELVIGLSGSGVARVNGAPRQLLPGSVVPLALGQTLEIGNSSAEQPLRYLIVKAG